MLIIYWKLGMKDSRVSGSHATCYVLPNGVTAGAQGLQQAYMSMVKMASPVWLCQASEAT